MISRAMLAASLLAALIGPTHAVAEDAKEVDVASISCKYLIDASKDDASTIMIWLHGYFGGKADDTTFNMESFAKSAEQMGAYCAEHPDIGVMSAAKTVFGP